jgi:hypothetical protein
MLDALSMVPEEPFADSVAVVGRDHDIVGLDIFQQETDVVEDVAQVVDVSLSKFSFRLLTVEVGVVQVGTFRPLSDSDVTSLPTLQYKWLVRLHVVDDLAVD